MCDKTTLSDAEQHLMERTPWGKLPYAELLKQEIDSLQRIERTSEGDVRYVHLDEEKVPEITDGLGDYLNYSHARLTIQRRGYRITYKTDNPGHVRFTLKRDEREAPSYQDLALHICTDCKTKHAYEALTDEYGDCTEAYCTECGSETEMMVGTPGKVSIDSSLPGWTQ